ncbi:MAG: hypothetical protein KAH93_04485 [Candidatus Aenigmarchaeota archaeon]|nr:hypothetical protein [Candidatus Aenigmarchaeota archaeon]
MDEGMFENYGRIGVVYSILDAVRDASGLDRGEIVQAVGLDDAVVAKYLDCMVGNDLLSSQDSKYLITLEGDDYRDKFEGLQSILEVSESSDKFEDL